MSRPLHLLIMTLAACTVSGCGQHASAPPPDTVVTSRSNGVAIPNPRGGSYAKSKPGTFEWSEPDAAKAKSNHR